MLAKVNSCAMLGLEGTIAEVEVDSARGLASFTFVGLPNAAIKNSGLHFPTNRVTVNLAPADLC
jgi:magnesium chelatase family protein